MAETTTTAPPAPAPAPAKEEAGLFTMPFTTEDGDAPDETDPSAETVEVPAVEAAEAQTEAIAGEDKPVEVAPVTPPPAPEVKQEAPKRLAEWRTEKGDIDEAKIEEFVANQRQVSNTLQQIEALGNKHPELQIALLKAMKAEGMQLAPEAEARIAEPKAPALTMEQIKAKTHEIELTQGTAEALAYWHENVTRPELAAQNAAYEAEKTARLTREQSEKAAATEAENVTRYKAEFTTAAKDYPSIVKEAKNKYGFEIVDKQIRDHILDPKNGLAHLTGTMPIGRLIKHALVDLDRYAGKPALTVKTATTTRPVIRGVVHEEKPTLGPGEYSVKFSR